MGSLFSKASEKQKEQNEQKSEVAEQSSPKPPQTGDVQEGDTKGQQDESSCRKEDTSKEEPSVSVAAGQYVVEEQSSPKPPQTGDVHEGDTKGQQDEASCRKEDTSKQETQPPAEPQLQPEEKEPEVGEAIQEQQPSEQQAEPIPVVESTPGTADKVLSEPAPPTTAVCGDSIVEPDKEEAANQVTSPAPEMHHPDVDKLADGVTQLKIVPDEAPAETSNEHEATSSVTTEARLETDSEHQPTVNDDQFIEQDIAVPVDSALEQRLVENEAA